ncbi:TetR/AcrR family transcriptional regulator [Mangrovicoccus sp. HB161399]|uniref:TetR/AcrR family transcriptional regulator n=1 Tax=Mangrovicoccus sp. HB161399 TaxID=2720392 RepID=UPI001556603B|nr:TetR/AcrR family transcriptional regulator [Mangrovicoccus sp. HB161399]
MTTEAPDLHADPRRAALLDAAASLFFERGYAATSIDAIIERAGGSKRTIYAMFGSKEGLFEALIRENTERMFSAELFGGQARPLEAALSGFAVHLLDLFTRPRTIALFRLVVAEAGRMPELAESFHRLGPLRGRHWLARVLERAQTEGEIRVADPQLLAGQFLGLVRSDAYFEIVLGLRGPLEPGEIESMAEAAVSTFLEGQRPARRVNAPDEEI